MTDGAAMFLAPDEPQQTEVGDEETLVGADIPVITHENSSNLSIYDDEQNEDGEAEDEDSELTSREETPPRGPSTG